MYHHPQHQGKNIQSSSRMPILPERHLFLQGGNGPGDSGLVLSTDAKPRLKWTPDLHERFIEAVNQLQTVLEKAQETLGMQNLGPVGLEAAKVQISQLVSKVSNQCLNSAFPDVKELQGLYPQPTQATQPTDCSIDSCLTSCDGSQKDQETHHNGMGLRPYNSGILFEHKEIIEEPMLPQAELKWCEDPKENKMFLSPMSSENDTERRMFSMERSSSDLSMSVGLHVERGNDSNGLPFNKARPERPRRK